MAKASITISEMEKLVRGLEDGVTDLRDAKSSLTVPYGTVERCYVLPLQERYPGDSI